jgi:hypothetical protein
MKEWDRSRDESYLTTATTLGLRITLRRASAVSYFVTISAIRARKESLVTDSNVLSAIMGVRCAPSSNTQSCGASRRTANSSAVITPRHMVAVSSPWCGNVSCHDAYCTPGQ